MAGNIGGARRKTRYKFKKNIRKKGKISIRRFFQAFKVGETVKLIAEPAFQKGMYFRRFHGKHGIIKGKRGKCYEVKINDKDKEKLLIVHPIHLMGVKNVRSNNDK